ncbi:hypothetical protein AYM40_15550 [Paraburkholderia phytofirmans OLGA172]|uniref:Uncharacterized protein n=1 Tax=Paraburkholderia phytofirmans OLGA172 TaxID=1417228 RepID=A0A161IBJ7_9BURK|nr:hypothetical protein [Paraburkholderia phytofirmans]ANB73613.1 hypothetical protein AYM40_15550 [Paraburkholderia phytofirmans OLGA172]
MNRISFGKSSVDEEHFHGAVAGGGAHGPGISEKVEGISERGDLLVKRLPMNDNRSGTKRSGSVGYQLAGDGVYRAYGYADSNRSEGPEVFFELAGHSLGELSRQQLSERLRVMSPHAFAKAEHAQRKIARRKELLPQVQAEIDELAADGERLSVTTIHVDDQLQLSGLSVNRQKACGHFAERTVRSIDDFVAELSKPSDPCRYCEAHTAQARTAEETLRRLLAAASAKSLPSLSGSPRQIKWALEIRDGFQEKNPTSPLLQRATTAKYWIEKRLDLK